MVSVLLLECSKIAIDGRWPGFCISIPIVNTKTVIMEHKPNTSSTGLKLKGNWNETKGKIKQQYANLTDNDLLYEEGKEDELYGRLQKHTGKTKEQVKEWIDKL